MSNVNCNLVEIIASANYRHFDTAVPFHLIPVRLADRLEVKMVSKQWYQNQIKGWGSEMRTNLDEVFEVTGLDKFYWREGEKCFTLSFKPLVGMKTAMGEGFIESLDQETVVEESPVIDFDYQDSSFESELEQIQAIIRTVNY